MRTTTPVAAFAALALGGSVAASSVAASSAVASSAVASSAVASSAVASSALAQVNPNYLAPKQYAVQNPPRRIHLSDLNGDGRADLVCSCESAGGSSISVLLASSNGGFVSAVSFAAGTAAGIPTSALGDFDGDGSADVVVATTGLYNTPPFTGQVLLGNGAGGFASGGSFPLKAYTRFLVPIDANQDGTLDLVGLNQVNHTASIYLGNGAGGFTDGGKLGTGTQPLQAAAGDLNGDGLPDLMVANYGSGTVERFLGTGGGNFTSAVTIAVGASPEGVALVDFDGDSQLDIAVTFGPGTVVSYLGDGLGGFAFASQAPVPSPPQALSAADFDGNGHPDLAVIGSYDGNVTLVLVGPGGALTPKPPAPSGQSPIDVAAGDLNGDGKADVATANLGGLSLGLNFGAGNGSLVATPTTPTGAWPGAIRTIDLDGDGNADLLVSNATPNNITLSRGDGQGHFAAATAVVAAAAVDFQVVNANEDGEPDLLAIESYGVSVHCHPGNGAGGFGPDIVSAAGGYQLEAIVAGDFDGDGHLDALVVDAGDLGHGNFTGTIRLLLGNGTGTFGFVTASPTSSFAIGGVAGDFNNDGLLDVAVNNFGDFGYPPVIDVFLGMGGTGFTHASAIDTFSYTPVAAADFDGDGHLDLAFGATALAPWFGDGLGGFTAGVSVTTPYSGALRAGDLDGDGAADLVAIGGSQLSILRNDGVGNLGAAESYTVSTPTDLAIADFDGDGRQDAAATQVYLGNVAILVNATIPAPGLASFGQGTPGCKGTGGLFANEEPKVGTSTFALYATNAPASAIGLALVTDAADAGGSDPFGLGVALHVDLFASTTILAFDLRSDASGAGFASAPIPNNPFLVGQSYYAQALWLWPALAPCKPTLFSLSSSRGLSIVIQS